MPTVEGQQKQLDAWCTSFQSKQQCSPEYDEDEPSDSVETLDSKTVEVKIFHTWDFFLHFDTLFKVLGQGFLVFSITLKTL